VRSDLALERPIARGRRRIDAQVSPNARRSHRRSDPVRSPARHSPLIDRSAAACAAAANA